MRDSLDQHIVPFYDDEIVAIEQILAKALYYPGKGQQKAFVDESDPGKELHDR